MGVTLPDGTATAPPTAADISHSATFVVSKSGGRREETAGSISPPPRSRRTRNAAREAPPHVVATGGAVVRRRRALVPRTATKSRGARGRWRCDRPAAVRHGARGLPAPAVRG